MKAFVAIGVTIIVTLTIMMAIADNCLTCCGGYSCNTEIYAKQTKGQRVN